PPPPPCFNRDPGTNPSVGSVATRVRRVRARLTSALYTPTACGQRPLTQAGGGQGKFRTRLSGLAPPSGPNRRTTMHSYSADPRPSPAKGGQAMRAQAAQSNGTRGRRQARKRQERFNDDKNKKTQSVVTALGLASGPQEEGGGGEKWEGVVGDMVPISPPRGGGAPAAARLQHAPLGLPRPRAGALSGRPASCPRARASQRGGQGARRGRAGKRPREQQRCLGLDRQPHGQADHSCLAGATAAGAPRAAGSSGAAGHVHLLRALVGRRPRGGRPSDTPAAGDLGDAGEHRAEDAVQQACGERADGEGLEAEPAPPRGWRGPLQHHLGRTSRSRHAPPRGAARPGEGGGGTVRGAPAAA
ncbi:unnamed protein product, partial [Prorocentrum cordatum]